MFLTAVEEKEIIDIVNRYKDKTSTDANNIDMKIVKKVIEGISEPQLSSVIYHSKVANFQANWK